MSRLLGIGVGCGVNHVKHLRIFENVTMKTLKIVARASEHLSI